MIRANWKVRGILAFAVGLAGAKLACAEITIYDDPTGIQDAATGEYQYNVELTGNDPSSSEFMGDGDGFVMYDFPGLVTSGPHAPTLTGLPFDMSVIQVEQSLLGNYLDAPPGPSATNVGPLSPNSVDNAIGPSNFLPADDPGIENVSFVYDGSSPVANIGSSADIVGVLTLWSTVAGPGASINLNGASDGAVDHSGAGTSQNFASDYNSVPVPEPASLATLGVVSLALFGGRRLRSQRA
jgi:hypothetical protein